MLGSRKELFAGALIKGGGMQLVTAQAPPPWKDGIHEEVGNRLLPDQGLDVPRCDECAFRSGEGIRQIAEGAHEVSPSPCRCADADEARIAPDALDAEDGDRRKIMRANEQRVAVEDFGAWRFVVRIVQSHESVAEERSQLTAGCLKLGRR